MKNKYTSGIVALIFLMSVILMPLMTGTAEASHRGDFEPVSDSNADLIVDASGNTGSYTTIQGAIDAASTGDTIKVKDGTYTSTTSGGSYMFQTPSSKSLDIHFESGAVVDGSNTSIGTVAFLEGQTDIKGMDVASGTLSADNTQLYYPRAEADYNFQYTKVFDGPSNYGADDLVYGGFATGTDITKSYYAGDPSESTIEAAVQGDKIAWNWDPYYEDSTMETLSDDGTAEVSSVDGSDGSSISTVDVEIVETSSGNVVHTETVSPSHQFILEDGMNSGGEDYDITVNADGYNPKTKTYTIDTDTITSKSYTLQAKTGSIEASVSDANDGSNPVDTTTVELVQGGSVLESKTVLETDSTNTVTFSGYSAGEDYTVETTNQYYDNSSKVVTNTEGTTDSVSFSLARALGTVEVSDVTDSSDGSSISGPDVDISHSSSGDLVSSQTGVSTPYTDQVWNYYDYDVQVTADDYETKTKTYIVSDGATTSKSYSLQKLNSAPTADFQDSDNASTTTVDTTVTLDASASSDADGDSLTYSWDTTGDGTYDDATGETIDVSESSTGTYNYSVEVSDGSATDTATYTLTVEEPPTGTLYIDSVQDIDDDPISDYTISVEQNDTVIAESTTSGDYSKTLEPGSYDVVISAEGFNVQTTQLDIESGITTNSSITLTASDSGYGTSTSIESASGVFGVNIQDSAVQTDAGETEFTVSVSNTSKLQEWADKNDSRKIQENLYGNTYTVTAPAQDVVSTGLFDSGGLSGDDYVESIDINIQTSVDPVKEPLSQNQHSDMVDILDEILAGWGADYVNTGIAHSSDIEKTDMEDARTHIGDENVSSEGSGIGVAVVDTGLNYDSTLYGDRVKTGVNTLTDETVDTSASNPDWGKISDGNGHGSWVASSVAANPSGTAYDGVATQSNLHIYKALDDEGGGTSADIAQAIHHAAENPDVDVINLSLGSQQYNQEIASEVQYAVDQDKVVVVAAGNSRVTHRFIASPADVDSEGVIAVAASNSDPAQEAEIGYFSEVGPDRGLDSGGSTAGQRPDVAAPGTKITTKVATTDGTVEKKTLTGTSMATPVVSGGVAVAMADDPNLVGQPVEVRQQIEEHYRPIPNAGITEAQNGMFAVDMIVQGETPETSQEDARNDKAVARDRANDAASQDNIIEKILG